MQLSPGFSTLRNAMPWGHEGDTLHPDNTMSFHIPYTPALTGQFLVSLNVNSFQNAVFSDCPSSHPSPKSLRKGRPWLEEAGVTTGAPTPSTLCVAPVPRFSMPPPMLAELTLDKFRTGVNKQITPHFSIVKLEPAAQPCV